MNNLNFEICKYKKKILQLSSFQASKILSKQFGPKLFYISKQHSNLEFFGGKQPRDNLVGRGRGGICYLFNSIHLICPSYNA